MKIGYVVDERRDPFFSTEAAARLLKKNYQELKEWPMAITAYNHGLNGMLRAKKSKKTYENIFKTYRSRSFKFASRNFYSEFLAARIVAENYQQYFGELVFEKPKKFQTIHTQGYLPVDRMAKASGITADQIRELNPSLRQPVFNGQKYIPKGFLLRLPVSMDKKTLTASLSMEYLNKQKPSRFHRVQKGDTAGAIARTHSVSLNDLILANGLNRRATIYIGQTLRIPGKDREIPKTAKPEPLAKNTGAPKKIVPPVAKSPKSKSKPIEPETEPAREAETPVAQSGQTVPPQLMTTDLKVFDIRSNTTPVTGFIRVEAEETLGHYADWLRIKTQQLRVWNKMAYKAHISIHQKIRLQFSNRTIEQFEEDRYDFHMEMREDFFESYTVQGTEAYQVKKGDNIWDLCMNELELPFWLLQEYNPKVDFSVLRTGQILAVPQIVDKNNQIQK